MTLPRAGFALVLATLASLGLSWLIQTSLAQEAEESPSGELGVEWAYRPASLGELVESTPATVGVEVEQVRAGAPIVVETGDLEDPTHEIPTQLVDVRVTETLDGQPPQQLTIFKLGGAGEHPVEDPVYRVGERYLLFIEPRLNDEGTALNPDGTWLVVAPDGRLEELPSGHLDAQVEGPVGEELDGQTVSQAEVSIDAAEGSP